MRCGLLRTASHSGSTRTHRPIWSSASITGMARCPARSRSTSAARTSAGHGSGIAPARGGQPVERRAVDAGVAGGRGGRRPQHEARVGAGIGVRGQVDLAVAQHEAVADRLVAAGPPAERAAQRGVDPLPGVVAAPGDRAGGGGQPGMSASADSSPQRRRHRVLLLEQQPVAGPAGAAVQLDPGRRAARRRPSSSDGVVALPEEAAGRLGPVQGVDVAQPAAALLEVGLEQEGHLAGRLVAAAHPAGELVEPALGPLLPLLERPAGEVVGEVRVAGEVADLQQRGGRVEVVGRQGQRLARRCAPRGRASGPRPRSGTRCDRRGRRCRLGRCAAGATSMSDWRLSSARP